MWSVLIALVLGGSAPGPTLPGPPTNESISEIVERVQAHYDDIQDFEAVFTQSVIHRILHKTIEESGTVAFKRPGRMRWQYRDPEKLLVTDGSKSYFYVPEDRQVIVSHTQNGAMALAPESPLSVIMGETRLLDAFEVTDSDTEPTVGGSVLRLIPRRPQEDFEEAEIEVHPEDGQVMRISLLDYQGNRTEFLFEDIRENRGLSDSLFRFEIPPGVDILIASEAIPARDPN
ncbi:MAG: outer membrane lipoprotein carrier protein LolA [Vicinamibacteria bacterium]